MSAPGRPMSPCVRHLIGGGCHDRRLAAHPVAGGRHPVPAAQRGLTLVELLVSLALSLIVALAAMAALSGARTGAAAVESSAALRDNGRFATDLVRRIALQSGFESVTNSVRRRETGVWGGGASPPPDVEGFNDAMLNVANPTATTNSSRDGACSVGDTSCKNGSDVLIVRYQGQSDSLGVADGSVINCGGLPVPDAAAVATRAYSVFHVQRANGGEPVLMCTYSDGAGVPRTVALIEGVETFQVLYGVDHVSPGVATTAKAASAPDLVRRYLRADQMVVPGNAAATRSNWRRVRSIRIGMVVRGPVGSAIDRTAAAAQTLQPLGAAFVAGADVGTALSVPADGRLRHLVTFTVQLRNSLELM